jgi:hypothetical protein
VGGFAGIVKPPLAVETDALPAADDSRIRELVGSARFFTLPAELPPDRVVPDSFGYTLTIRGDKGEEHSVSFTDRSLPDELRELVSAIRHLANSFPSG